MPGPYTGAAAMWGLEWRRAHELGAEDIKAKGGVKVGGDTYNFDLIFYDLGNMNLRIKSLDVVLKLAKEHGGTISVDSEVEKGTTFIVLGDRRASLAASLGVMVVPASTMVPPFLSTTASLTLVPTSLSLLLSNSETALR